MHAMRPALGLLFLLLAPAGVSAAGLNRVYLVPALVECPGPATCARTFASAYTFDSIVLRTPATRYTSGSKPSFVLDLRGVRDPSGAPVNGTLTLRVRSGRVSLPGLGTFPDDSPLTQQAPVSIPLRNGNGKVSYRPATPPPNGLVVNGGGVEVLDPQGQLLAVTGTQSKP